MREMPIGDQRNIQCELVGDLGDYAVGRFNGSNWVASFDSKPIGFQPVGFKLLLTDLVAPNPMVRGSTILLGDGAYFDYANPDAFGATVLDYAWGLASKGRFNGQTRIAATGERCIITVLQHVVQLCRQMIAEGQPLDACREGLLHESDEVVGPDFASSLKPHLHPTTKLLFADCGDAFDRRFDNPNQHKALVKQYDLRMLATEKRDLMPHAADHQWSWVEGIEPFDFTIMPWPHEDAVDAFLVLFDFLDAHRRLQAGHWNKGAAA